MCDDGLGRAVTGNGDRAAHTATDAGHGEPEGDAPAAASRAESAPDGVNLRIVDALAKPFRKIRDYCRVEVEGLENIPAGKCIIAANHTGWLGLDNANLVTTIYDKLGRFPRTAVHPSFFRSGGVVREASEGLGFFEVSVTRSTQLLDEGNILMFFPEAEDGNFKPIWEFYRLQPFKPGAARVALATGAPIVPVAIIGGEEANPSLARLDSLKRKFGVALPVPLNVLPFPVKWRISFLPPIDAEAILAQGMDSVELDAAERITRELQDRIQVELKRQLEVRGNPFW